MITLNLQPLFTARGIDKPYTFLVKSGFAPYTAHNLLYANYRNIKFDHIEKLCLILYCTPHDLIDWTPNRNQIISENHPIHILKKEKRDYSIKDVFFSLTLDEIAQLAAQIKGKGKQDEGIV